ncbi:manganese efflux pump MntP [Lysinibacillus piscis]|uniref:Sporulation membrane protein YtaF n=1 Tax=Lysinibacillus piscis TaxID=2518931 RepID=A0ABQ5NHE4_9BACI|nr:hypothetical protein [Lysinibacillus sp. KH24]GLC87710.1 hypothetical protein LYSBPC_08370 [Lysinibacillus sp. KH24]
MYWLTILFVGLAANLDNLGVSLAYGMKRIKIPIGLNIVIASIAMVVTYLAICIGSVMQGFMSNTVANIIGSGLLVIIGIWTLATNHFSKKCKIDGEKWGYRSDDIRISLKEAIWLGLILSANGAGSGIAIGVNAIPAIWAVTFIGIFSFLTVGMGSHCGTLLAKSFIGRHSTSLAGWLLIVIGILELFIQ